MLAVLCGGSCRAAGLVEPVFVFFLKPDFSQMFPAYICPTALPPDLKGAGREALPNQRSVARFSVSGPEFGREAAAVDSCSRKGLARQTGGCPRQRLRHVLSGLLHTPTLVRRKFGDDSEGSLPDLPVGLLLVSKKLSE